MGLSWQQGPLGRNPNGRFLVPGMPERVLYAEPLRRTAWFEVVGGGDRRAARGAWQHVALPEHASLLEGKVALAWRAMDGFYEEDDR